MGADLDEIDSSCGVNVRPWETFREPREFDYIVVVGGLLHQGPIASKTVQDYLRLAAKQRVTLVGLCTGSFALIRAGLMSGRRCCVSWFHYQDLLAEFTDVIPVADRLYVDDGDRITCSGGTVAADLASLIIERHLGRDWARKSLSILGMDEARSSNAAQPRPTNEYTVKDERVKRALLIMQQNMERPLSSAEIAKALSAALGRKLIRLQCYEGLDASSAVYEWNFPAQMVAIRSAEAAGSVDRASLTTELFSEDFLIERPLLDAMRPQGGGAPVLLIDELDRTDEPFEAFLLEALSDFQVTIPELGTIKAPEPPIVILTSNRTREVHDALKRRCLYHWVDYPDFEREMEILTARAPEAAETLSREVVAFVQKLRTEDLFKKPGVAETIDWAKCLLALDVITLSPEVIADTLGAILKYQDDIAQLQGSEAKRILDEAKLSLETL